MACAWCATPATSVTRCASARCRAPRDCVTSMAASNPKTGSKPCCTTETKTGPEGPVACDSVTCDQPRSAFARFFGAGDADATFVPDELSIGAAVEDEAVLLLDAPALLPT